MTVIVLVISTWLAIVPTSPSHRCLIPPVHAPVVVPFRLPACPYCSGHRGIEYAVDELGAVHAVAGGVVTFSGVVAGTGYVVVEHDDGIVATYGMLDDTPLHRGESVRAGQLIGRASPRLYFGLRRAGEYIDPLPLLATQTFRHRLVPTDGSSARPRTKGVPTCPAHAGTDQVAR
jgi:murein DD-endopeptidase MepM/ murein hydrolase activator NlpD